MVQFQTDTFMSLCSNENNMEKLHLYFPLEMFFFFPSFVFWQNLPMCYLTMRFFLSPWWKGEKLLFFQWNCPFSFSFCMFNLYVLCVRAHVLPINRLCICALTTSMYDISVGIIGKVRWFSENALDQTAALAKHWPQNILNAKLSQDSERKCV